MMEAINNKLPALNAALPNINRGGCGFFALYLSKQLQKKNIDHKIIPLGCSYHKKCRNDNDMIDLIKNDETFFIPNSHIVVEVDGILYDSEGEIGEERYNDLVINGGISQLTLCNMLNLDDMWNDEFPRYKRIIIKRYLSKLFEEINDDH
jgi:hypothetical protein